MSFSCFAAERRSRRLGLLAAALTLGLASAPAAFAQTAAPATAPAAKKPAAAPAAPKPAAPGPALGQEDSGPTRTTATYDDWVVRCERSDVVGGAKVCEAAQTLQIGNPQQGLSAQVVFGRLTKEAPMRLVVQLPVGVWLPTGIRFVYGEKARTVAAQYKFCIRACIADVELSAEDVAELGTAAGPGKLEFLDRNQQPVALDISFKGLAAALAARDKG
ncbi:invasion associated locus B family protein [Azorhizobium doebereinerae]|uniref:invasion associated locus B family protein n=1 Tax=Azorhizobium doebereinerae TaxID=281091 RepID=UPI00040DD430|nr:invasion associated locus B family protein [Azorhizobium doebereinerae]